MTLSFELDPAVSADLKDGLCRLWADVVNAGGAVGFVPPVTAEDVRPALLKHLVAMDEGRTRLLAARDEEGAVVGAAFLGTNTHRLKRHWVGLYTVMVHPARQGGGEGRELMAAAAEAARGMDGVEAVQLTLRGGLGLERFYAACGYKEVGRVPDGLRLGEGDYRDDVVMWLPLH